MSELKTRFIDDTYVEYYNTGKHDLAQIYLKSEADKVIEELKADNESLVKENERIKRLNEIVNNELVSRKWVDYNRRLTLRALWLARAERAKEHYHRYHGRFLPDLKLTDIPEYNKWVNVEKLCRAKAEEYK